MIYELKLFFLGSCDIYERLLKTIILELNKKNCRHVDNVWNE